MRLETGARQREEEQQQQQKIVEKKETRKVTKAGNLDAGEATNIRGAVDDLVNPNASKKKKFNGGEGGGVASIFTEDAENDKGKNSCQMQQL